MDRDEERKAFESIFMAIYPVTYRDSLEGNKKAIASMEDAWAGWLLAKEHFEQMAKTPVVMYTVDQTIIIREWKDDSKVGDFLTREAAEKFINEKGYRLVK